MSVLTPRLSAGMFATLGVVVAGAATPAVAFAGVDGCGDAPADGELTRAGDVCQVVFNQPALDTAWTVPAGLTTIHAVITGGGGGASVYTPEINGYAGDGGDVRYVDLTGTAAGSVLDVVVGAPGMTDDVSPMPGGDTVLGATTATGGSAADFGDGCANVDAVPYLRTGVGAGENEPNDCADITGVGIVPASDLDSVGASPLALFAGYGAEHGRGGAIDVIDVVDVTVPVDKAAADVPTAQTGAGAGVTYDTAATPPLSGIAAEGGSVIIRYGAVVPQLASTGAAESAVLFGLGAALFGTGAGALALDRRRSRRRASLDAR